MSARISWHALEVILFLKKKLLELPHYMQNHPWNKHASSVLPFTEYCYFTPKIKPLTTKPFGSSKLNFASSEKCTYSSHFLTYTTCILENCTTQRGKWRGLGNFECRKTTLAAFLNNKNIKSDIKYSTWKFIAGKNRKTKFFSRIMSNSYSIIIKFMVGSK